MNKKTPEEIIDWAKKIIKELDEKKYELWLIIKRLNSKKREINKRIQELSDVCKNLPDSPQTKFAKDICFEEMGTDIELLKSLGRQKEKVELRRTLAKKLRANNYPLQKIVDLLWLKAHWSVLHYLKEK